MSVLVVAFSILKFASQGLDTFRVDHGRLWAEMCECRIIKTEDEIEIMRYVNKISRWATIGRVCVCLCCGCRLCVRCVSIDLDSLQFRPPGGDESGQSGHVRVRAGESLLSPLLLSLWLPLFRLHPYLRVRTQFRGPALWPFGAALPHTLSVTHYFTLPFSSLIVLSFPSHCFSSLPIAFLPHSSHSLSKSLLDHLLGMPQQPPHRRERHGLAGHGR